MTSELEQEAFEIWHEHMVERHSNPREVMEMLSYMVAWTAFAGVSPDREINEAINDCAERAKTQAAIALLEYMCESMTGGTA